MLTLSRLSVMARPVWSLQWMMRARLCDASRHSASLPSLLRSKGTCEHGDTAEGAIRSLSLTHTPGTEQPHVSPLPPTRKLSGRFISHLGGVDQEVLDAAGPVLGQLAHRLLVIDIRTCQQHPASPCTTRQPTSQPTSQG